NDVVMLLVRQRRAFAGRAHRNEAVGALGDLPIDQGAERFLIDSTVLERGYERGERASELGLGSHDTGPWCGPAASGTLAVAEPTVRHKYRFGSGLERPLRGQCPGFAVKYGNCP